MRRTVMCANAAARFYDQRSRKVVVLAHCLLNENTRYAGGACRPGAVDEVVQACLEHQLGIIQMPCPEQIAWGGVLKPRLWSVLELAHTQRFSRFQSLVLWLLLWHTRRIYRRVATQVAQQVVDYQRSGCEVIGIVGVDGSPSCGLHRTLDVARFLREWNRLPKTAQAADLNSVIMECATAGHGIFVEELQRQLGRRGAGVRWFAHDLIAELRGKACPLRLNAAASMRNGQQNVL
jgi:predicted secreted protein